MEDGRNGGRWSGEKATMDEKKGESRAVRETENEREGSVRVKKRHGQITHLHFMLFFCL